MTDLYDNRTLKIKFDTDLETWLKWTRGAKAMQAARPTTEELAERRKTSDAIALLIKQRKQP